MDPLGAAAAAAGRAVDPAAAEAARIGGQLMTNLFGPITEQMGADLLEKYKRRNVRRVVEKAEKKGGAGSIPPRVGAAVFDAAAFADDEFVAEYLSGVLASSRTETGSDDRGVGWTALVARLSSDQLRMHFAVYSILQRLVVGKQYEPATDLLNLKIYIRYDTLVPFLGYATGVRVTDALYALLAEDLLSFEAHGGSEFLTNYFHAEVPASGFVFRPQVRGILLFLNAQGLGQQWISRITSEDSAFLIPEDGVSALFGQFLTDLPKLHDDAT